MYEAEKATYLPDQIYAGDFPVEIGLEKAKTKINKHTLVALTAGALVKVTAENVADIYGITADDAEANEEVAVYLTGAFKGDAIDFGAANEADAKVALRKIGIFIK